MPREIIYLYIHIHTHTVVYIQGEILNGHPNPLHDFKNFSPFKGRALDMNQPCKQVMEKVPSKMQNPLLTCTMTVRNLTLLCLPSKKHVFTLVKGVCGLLIG